MSVSRLAKVCYFCVRFIGLYRIKSYKRLCV
nr:MAG TPA: hypothetical protein [Caudoviricetes sp.]